MSWWTARGVKARNSETRRRAAEKLGASADPDALRLLLELLEDANADVRAAAATALARVADPAAVSLLIRSLGDPNERVRAAAASALKTLGEGRLAGALLRALRSDTAARQELAALVRHRDLRPAAALIEALGNSQPSARDAAAQALQDIGEERITGAVLGMLDGEAAGLEESAALASEGDARAVRPLMYLLGDSNPQLRECAAQGLLAIGGSALPALARVASQELRLKREQQGRWGEGGSDAHLDACVRALQVLARLCAAVPLLPPDRLPAVVRALEDATPMWKRTLRPWSGLPPPLRQPLRELLAAAQRVFWKV